MRSHQDFEKDFGYTIEEVETMRKLFKTHRKRKESVWKLLDAYDSGEFWETLRAKLPKHQIIPDTNYVFYIRDNIVNSTYSAPYIADVLPVDSEDMDEARKLNKLIEYDYNRKELGELQLRIGARTALLNVSFLQIGWDSTKSYTIKDNVNKGDFVFTKRDAMATLLDPNFEDFQKGRALFFLTEDSFENVIAKYPEAKAALLESQAAGKDQQSVYINSANQEEVGKGYFQTGMQPTAEGMVPVFITFKRVATEKGETRVDQIIYTDGLVILEARKGIKPSYFPVVALYDSPPEKDAYGVGRIERVMKNILALNVLDSIAVTHTYAAQRAPYVLNLDSGLDPKYVTMHINSPDKVFPISGGDPTKALYRLIFPELPGNLNEISTRLETAIHKITGVDDKYTGRDTASITTTGGMERMQARLSMTDNTRIQMIEKYARDITRMIMDFYVEDGGTRYFSVNPGYSEEESREVQEVDFSKYKQQRKGYIHQFAYHIDASPLLPKSRARLAESANMIMQMQMQFQGQMDLLSPEEWLFFQDFPQKDMILDRMKIERLRDDHEEIASEITSFGAMTEEGMRPESAIDQLANERAASRSPSVRKKQLEGMRK